MAITIPTADPRTSGSAFMPQLRAALGAAAPWDGTVPINQVPTHLFFESLGAKIFKWGDRAFFGDAAVPLGQIDWSEAMRMYRPLGVNGSIYTGFVNTSGSTVTWVSGNKFEDVFRSQFHSLIGQTIWISGVGYTITADTSDTSLQVTPSPGSQSNVAYTIGQGMLESGSKATVTILNDLSNLSSQNCLLTGFKSGLGPGGYGQASIAVNNNSTSLATVWAHYVEAHRMNSVTGWAVGMELEVVNRGNAIVEDPYNSFNTKQVQALQLGSGAGLTGGQNNTTTALVIFANGSQFNAGIMYAHDSLAAAGPGGTISAIQLPALYEIQGYSAAATLSYRLYGDAGNNAVFKSGARLYLQPTTNCLIDGASSLVDSTEDGSVLTLRSTTTAALDVGPTLRFSGKTNNGNDPYAFASISGRKESIVAANYAGYLEFNTMAANGQQLERMRIDSLGNTTVTAYQDGQSNLFILNTNPGLTSTALIGATSNLASISMRAHASARTTLRYGIALGGYSELNASAGNGLLIGTFTNATPIIFGTNGIENLRITGADILPGANYFENLGAIDKKFLTLYAAELWVETLVAQDTIATIGGRILVGPTTSLIAALSTGATTVDVKHNQMASGDCVYMEAAGKVEFMSIDSGPSTITGGYRYTVTRNLDGSGANQWYAGDAVFNTGQTGNGFIDIYSLRGVKASTEIGPTIVGNIRNSATYNDWSSGWAIGNLKGIYGYSATTFGVAFGKYAAGIPHITIDATNGYRAFSDLTTVRLQINTSGVMTLNDSTGTAKITLDGSGGMTLDGKLQMLGASSAIAIGVLPPLSSAIGTGLWQDRTGLYGILGVLQVETATVIGAITGSGNAAVIVTAASMVGTPRTVQVPVINGDSISTVAGKIRTALAADATVAAFFTVSGSGADVIITDKYGRANDGTMNINIANNTCTGLTTVNSANTVAGSNTTQVKLDATTGAIAAAAGNLLLDVNGLTINSTSALSRYLTFQYNGSLASQLFSLAAGNFNISASLASSSDVTLIANSNATGSHICDFTIHAGSTASGGPYAALWSESGSTSLGLIIGASGANIAPTAMLDVRGSAILTNASPIITWSDTTASSGVQMTLGSTGGYCGWAANRNFVTGGIFNTGKATGTYLQFVGNGDSFHAWGTTPTNNTDPVYNMVFNKNSCLKIGGGLTPAARGTTEGTNKISIFNGTAPVGTLSNGIDLYATAGELRVMDSGGTASLLSPHASDAPEWMYDVEDTMPPNISRETNAFAGTVRFINLTRQARLQSLLFEALPMPTDPKKRRTIHEETFADYNKRLKLIVSDPRFLIVADWDQDQENHVRNTKQQHAEWQLRKEAHLIALAEHEKAKTLHESKNDEPFNEEGKPTLDSEPVVHTKLARPRWLK